MSISARGRCGRRESADAVPAFQPAEKIQQAIPQTEALRVKFATKDVCYSTFHFLTTA
ncbi:hypothetical protein BCAR13_800097 [Paraburkholderia caribensis]|nr:hypothetical protein BCAR13_800097 [Paraburkholderia caribensis]